MLLGFVIFYVPLALIAVLLVFYFQDLGIKLILFLAAVWFGCYWLLPQMLELPRASVFVVPGDSNIRLRAIFAGVEGAIAAVMFLVAKIRTMIV